MIYLLYFIHIIVSIFLILVVLLQQGKGADLSVFGGGGTQVAFGARGTATVLHKLTVACFILFLFTTITLSIFGGRGTPSVMRGVATAPAAAEESPLTGPAGGSLDAAEDAIDGVDADEVDGGESATATPGETVPEGETQGGDSGTQPPG